MQFKRSLTTDAYPIADVTVRHNRASATVEVEVWRNDARKDISIILTEKEAKSLMDIFQKLGL